MKTAILSSAEIDSLKVATVIYTRNIKDAIAMATDREKTDLQWLLMIAESALEALERAK